ncbi:MAG: hypothetical protein ACXVHT_06225 [Methanobacterium sp.]
MEVIFEYSEERYEKITARISLNDTIKNCFFAYDLEIYDKEYIYQDIYADIESAKHSLLIDEDVDMSKVAKYHIILLKRDLIIRKECYEGCWKS